MYTRQTKLYPKRFIENGKPLFGTFEGHPPRLDIRGVKQPYITTFLPTVISNLRIKSRLSFFFSVGEFIGCIDFFDAKIFGFAEVCFWNTTTKQRFIYRSVMGPRKRFVPHNLNTAITASYNKMRYIRISWDRNHNKLSVIFNLRGNSVRPSSNGALCCSFNSTEELSLILPAPIMRRCSAHYYTALPLRGSIIITPEHQDPRIMKDTNGCAFLDINRTYMKFKSKGEFITGLGTINGKQLTVRLESGSQVAVERDKYNGNALFYDGKVTPLPPVVITHPYGIMNKWIIQDTENMVDLTFTPVANNSNVISVLILRSEYHTLYGTLEGTLVTKDGEKISFHSLLGLTKKYFIRL